MKILFISSGNSQNGISPIIINQGNSLEKLGIQVEYFPVVGKGIHGYLSNIIRLRKHIRSHTFDVIHAHYSLIGIIASLAGARPLYVSLMGSDIYEFRWLKIMTKFFSRFFWKCTIVKSEAMKRFLQLPKAIVLPNGVDFVKFRLFNEDEIRNKLPLFSKPIVLFLGNPSKGEKNINLAREAMQKVKEPNHQFLPLYDVDNDLVPYYMNAASVLLMTSLWEGSPNVIKEAMACNLPIVTVDVGDVKEVIGNTEGCYVTSYQSNEIAEKVERALQFGKRTEGRNHIQHLDSLIVAQRLLSLYQGNSKQ